MNTAISPVQSTMPIAIQDALPPTVSSGLMDFDAAPGSLPEPTPAITPAASATTAPIRSHAALLMGPRVSFRSVRYQWPRRRPSRTAPVNRAPASSWKTVEPSGSETVRAKATSMATDRGTERIPRIRATEPARTASRMSQASVAPAMARASATASRPSDPAEGANAPAPAPPAPAADARTTAPVRKKNPRRTSFHSGVRKRMAAAPAADSARTRAITPAGPLISRRGSAQVGRPLHQRGVDHHVEARWNSRVEGAAKGRTDLGRGGHLLAVAAQSFHHPVVRRLGVELRRGSVARAVQHLLGNLDLPPRAVVTDDPDERDLLADGALVLHRVQPERPVAVDDENLFVGLGQLGGHGEGGTYAEAAERARVEPVSRVPSLDDRGGDPDDVPTVTDHNRVGVEEIPDLPGEPLRMDGDGVGLHPGPCFLPEAFFLGPNLAGPRGLLGEADAGVDELLDHLAGVADDPHVDRAVAADVRAIDVDLDDRRLGRGEALPPGPE